jgi:hypothetical protein
LRHKFRNDPPQVGGSHDFLRHDGKTGLIIDGMLKSWETGADRCGESGFSQESICNRRIAAVRSKDQDPGCA